MVPRLESKAAPHAESSGLLANDADQQAKAAYLKVVGSPTAEAMLGANNFAGLQASVFWTSTYKFTDTEKQGFLAAWTHGLTGPCNYYRDFIPNQNEYLAQLRGIKVPLMVLWGEGDQNLSAKNLIGLENYVRYLKVVKYPTATHWLTNDHGGRGKI